jgi:photosystem II stability/assembly factor-like uncharacterized protein
MHGHTRSLVSIFIVAFFTLFLTLAAVPFPQSGGNGGVALADPGSGWQEQDIPIAEGEITAISAISPSTAWATFGPPLTMGARVLKTDNGGSDWCIQDIEAIDEASTDIYAADESNIMAIGTQNAYKTFDGGLTWSRAYRTTISPSGGMLLQDICALDTNTALFTAYVYNSFSGWPYTCWWDVFRTSDGGITWTSCTPGQLTASPVFYEDVSSIDVADDSTIWMSLLTSTKQVFRSTDEGITWDTFELNDYYIHDICALDSSTAWAVGSGGMTTPGNGAGVILKTTDGGATWDVQHLEEGHSLSGISAIDSSTAWAVGELDTTYASADEGVILKTTDGGTTWDIEYEFTGGYLSSVCAIDASTAWAGGKGLDGSPLMLKSLGELSITSINPDQAIQHTIAMNVTDLSGSGFMPGATVKLERGESVIEGYSVQVVSDTKITCLVGFLGVEPGAYDVVVTNPDGQEVRLEEGFTVTPVCGAGSGISLVMLGLCLGLLSLAGTSGLKRGKKK